MSEQSRGPGWWVASDGKWYPPHLHPNYQPPPPPPPAPGSAAPPPAPPRQRTAVPPEPLDRAAPARKSRRNLYVALGLVVFVGVCSAIASNGVDEGEKVGSGSVTTADSAPGDTAAAPTTAAPGTSASPAALKVGDKARLDDGSTVQVHAYAAPVESSNQFSKPKAGNQFVAIDVEGCAGSRAQDLGVNSVNFALAMPDNTRVTVGVILGKEPTLKSSAQPAGTCNRGWVNFEIPTTTKPAAVLYTGFATSVRWAIP